jgi:hypothetical protein
MNCDLKSIRRLVMPLAAAAIVLSGSLVASADGDHISAIRVLSSPPDMVSGTEALVQVNVPIVNGLRVTLNGQDVTGDFQGSVGLVTGLVVGDNRLQLLNTGRPVATLDITDYPITGPIFSGPQQEPFICTTESFALPVTGVTLGPPLDANCSAATRVDYVYMSTNGTLMPLPNPLVRPSDLAQTTTSNGQTVNYIVRVETGTINRAIYQIGILHDPVTDPTPDPWHQPAGWNGRLVYAFGGGCEAAYNQGLSTGGVLNDILSNNAFLAMGYAMASSTLNVFGNDCNDLITAETTMMVKGRFINDYGVPVHTIGWGGSGGSMQQHMVAQNYPGLLDGILPSVSFPDIFTIVMPVTDCSLLNQVFNTGTLSWTVDQQTAVAGYPSWPVTCQNGWMAAGTVGMLGFSPGWITAGASACNSIVPVDLLYNPATNPEGARCDLYDNQINAFGYDPRTGFARRPLDNVGVQYGLGALNAGTISFAQFVDLNQRIGGYDIDGNIVSTRTVTDPQALRIAYRSGRTDSGSGGLGLVPIIDLRPYTDDNSSGLLSLHSRYESFMTRARLVAANGDAGNQVMLVTALPSSGAIFGPQLIDTISSMDQWLDNIANDPAPLSHEKVVRDRPVGLVDACYSPTGQYIPEPATYNGPGQCNQLYPSHADPRLVAGEPLVGDILKCQLKPVDRHDYVQPLTASQLAQLRAIFPQGVCDYTRPGVEQQLIEATWLTYPSPGEFEQTSESVPTRDRDDLGGH